MPARRRAAKSTPSPRNIDDSQAPTLSWANGTVRLLDQTRLPVTCKVVTIRTVREMWDAIRRLVVRGAPAIGCAAAYGVVLGVQHARVKTPAAFRKAVEKTATYLATSRPTAVNLFWALDRMKAVAQADGSGDVVIMKERLLQEAHAILEEDTAMCRAIGRHGLTVLPRKDGSLGILTHCNAGSLATSAYGTALAVMYAAAEAGRELDVYADETRPLLQGARLTTWELMRAGIPVTLICDNMACQVMKEGRIDVVIVGADRIAANGDAANKIGTCGVAILARQFGIPFYIAAPMSTIDFTITEGSGIPIEERDGNEIRRGLGTWTAPRDVPTYNPAFDVTPAKWITGIITDRGVVEKPTRARLRSLLGKEGI